MKIMTVKEAITIEMEKLSKNPKVVFLGENIINSKRIYGTLDNVPLTSCIETPVAENLIAGMAIGLSLRGYIPICIFQRMDFMLIAADQIINHACVYPKLGVSCPVIFRTIKATLEEKFYVGHQHSKDLSHVFEPYLTTINIPQYPLSISSVYSLALNNVKKGKSTLIVEDYQSFKKPLK